MSDKAHAARITAVSLAHVAAVAKLLRAHGEARHAENLDAALCATVRIMGVQLGSDTLAEALRWVSDETGGPPAAPPVHH